MRALFKYFSRNVPVLGKILNDRDQLLAERDFLLNNFNGNNESRNHYSFNDVVTRTMEKKAKSLIDKCRYHKHKIMLNVGCGTDYKDGWINIDNNSDNNIDKLDLEWDLRRPLPFPSNSVDYIYNEHFLEHLTIEEALATLRDFKRVLTIGGVMRLATPDLEDVIDLYLSPKWKDDPIFKQYGLSFIQTRAEYINIAFRWWGHQHLYNREELLRRLREAGFTTIRFKNPKKSHFPELKNLETRDQSTLIAEAMK